MGYLWHNPIMRTMLTIDDDLLAEVKRLAKAKSDSVGHVLSDLARRGLQVISTTDSPHGEIFPVFFVPSDAHPITLDDVRKLDDGV